MNVVDQKLFNTTLALAGMFQAALLVRDLAKTGETDVQAFTASVGSIYKLDAKDVPEVYGGTHGVYLGLREIIKLLGNDKTKAKTDPYVGRYAISLIYLERRLMQKPDMLEMLKRRITHAVSQANYFSPTHPNVLASLADTYLNTLGTLQFRIHILGQVKFLQNPDVVSKIRTMLLAGVRSAVLWRQVGGARWQLFFQRRKLCEMAKRILKGGLI